MYFIVVFYDIRDLWIIYKFIDFNHRYYIDLQVGLCLINGSKCRTQGHVGYTG